MNSCYLVLPLQAVGTCISDNSALLLQVPIEAVLCCYGTPLQLFVFTVHLTNMVMLLRNDCHASGIYGKLQV